MTARLAHVYRLFRRNRFVGRSHQLYLMPASEALAWARRYIILTSGLDLKPGISGIPNNHDRSAYDAWRPYGTQDYHTL